MSSSVANSAVSNKQWSVLTAPQALLQYAPVAAAALRDLIAATAMIDGRSRPALLARALCATTLSLPAFDAAAADLAGAAIADWRATAYDADEQVVLAFAEQFSIDVSAIDDELRANFLRVFGDAAFAAAMSFYVADFTPRLHRVLEQLFSPAIDGWVDRESLAVDMAALDFNPAFQEFIRVVYNMQGLDPVTTELVRLRGARQHQCRLCKSLRAQSALAAGADENAFAAVDNYQSSHLAARQKAALALTDALIWQPAHISDAVIDDIRAHFTPAEAVELVLDVMRNAANKGAVALAADAPFSDEVQVYHIDEAGAMHFGLESPPVAASL